MISPNLAIQKIIPAVEKRSTFEFNQSTNVCRLFNGFYEGLPGLVIDRFGSALVILDHNDVQSYQSVIELVKDWAMIHLKGIDAIVYKQRQHPQIQYRQGILLTGDQLPGEIIENDLRYAVDLRLNQDTSFYLDTRDLRLWLSNNAMGKRVLNTFAYTGSLGIAAGVGGALKVIQTDLNTRFLKLARRSWALNQLPTGTHHLITGDFFKVAARLRNAENFFDIVILDPPFFSTTRGGTVDLQNETSRLVNKVRPLVAHNGWLVVINNALYHSGADFMAELNTLCQSVYLSLEAIIPVPQDVTGYPETIISAAPVDPTPFNHTTKIAVLKVNRKDQRT